LSYEHRGEAIAMTSAIVTAKWTLDDYHRMIEAGILCDR
jgi:hypothetical protein